MADKDQKQEQKQGQRQPDGIAVAQAPNVKQLGAALAHLDEIHGIRPAMQELHLAAVRELLESGNLRLLHVLTAAAAAAHRHDVAAHVSAALDALKG